MIEEELDLEDREMLANRDRLRECLIYFKWLAKNNGLSFKETGNIVDTFFKNYPNLYQYYEAEISAFLTQKKFKEKSALHEMLYCFLENENTKELKRMPFVHDIKEEDKKYTIDTSLGRVSLRKASEYFSNTKSKYIFKKTLAGMCFDRTTEFVEQNPEYQAIVSYLPNVFVGGHYHAYAKKEDIIVDPACNAMFLDGTGELIEQGEIIYQTTTETLQKESNNDDYPKLLVAAIKHKNNK